MRPLGRVSQCSQPLRLPNFLLQENFASTWTMAWPQFMSSSFPSSANTNHTLKPSIYFLNAAADLPANNGFRSAGMDDHLLRNLFEGEATEAPAPGGAKGSAVDGSAFREVTLEDYLSKSRVIGADDVKTSAAASASERIGQVDLEETGNHMVGIGDDAVAGGGERVRGRKRPAVDSADRAALQRQKRMIKNRESAARSRERKQVRSHVWTFINQLSY